MRRLTVAFALLAAACAGSTGTATTTPPPTTVPAPTTTTTSSTTIPATTAPTTTPPYFIPSTTAPHPDARVCWAAPTGGAPGAVRLSDVTAERGVWDPLLGMHAHALAWGDVDGDGWEDLFVGSFGDRPESAYALRGATGPSPDRLLLGGSRGFTVDESFPGELARTSGAAFADFDNDGDLDLVVARNHRSRAPVTTDTVILRNDGGRFGDPGVIISGLGSRSIGVLDFDGDGLLDLFIVEDRWTGGSSRLFRNEGGLAFADATTAAGLPTDVHGLGVTVADLTADGWADIFVAGSNRLFVATAPGMFAEGDSAVFAWEIPGSEDDPAGVVAADLTRDGLPELIVGQHFNSTLEGGDPQPLRLYLHRGVDDNGFPDYEDITTSTPGLVPFPTKSPGVDVADLDNDGWPDIVTTAGSGDGSLPAVFIHNGVEDGMPSFRLQGELGTEQYWVTGAATDANHDGGVDIMLIEWEPALPSPLISNETLGGHWLGVEFDTQALGSVVEVYREGGIGSPADLLGVREVTVSVSYGAARPPTVRFGLGTETVVDLVIRMPHGGTVSELRGVPVDVHIRIPGGCS